jgi:hypothetical protein
MASDVLTLVSIPFDDTVSICADISIETQAACKLHLKRYLYLPRCKNTHLHTRLSASFVLEAGCRKRQQKSATWKSVRVLVLFSLALMCTSSLTCELGSSGICGDWVGFSLLS